MHAQVNGLVPRLPRRPSSASSRAVASPMMYPPGLTNTSSSNALPLPPMSGPSSGLPRWARASPGRSRPPGRSAAPCTRAAGRCTRGSRHGQPADDHRLDHEVGDVAQDLAVLERPRLALVGVADDVLLRVGPLLVGHLLPLAVRVLARPAHARQPRRLDLLQYPVVVAGIEQPFEVAVVLRLARVRVDAEPAGDADGVFGLGDAVEADRVERVAQQDLDVSLAAAHLEVPADDERAPRSQAPRQGQRRTTTLACPFASCSIARNSGSERRIWQGSALHTSIVTRGGGSRWNSG